MKPLVVDCSLAVHWFFDDEFDLDADSIYGALRSGRIRIHVPHVFFPEVANTLLVGERRGRCVTGRPEEFMRILTATSLRVDEEEIWASIYRTYGLAKTYGLTAYDACYLELALRLNASLATRDAALERAARAAGVTIIQNIPAQGT